MGRFSRFRRAVARAISRVIPLPTRLDRDEDREPPRGDGGGFIDRGDDRDFDYGSDRGGMESQLPEGWSLVGLYHHGEGTTRIDVTHDTEVTDSQIEGADALIVWYEPAGDDGYRWIHGAAGWDGLYYAIDHTITMVSPPKK